MKKRKEIFYPTTTTTTAEKYLIEGSGLHFNKMQFSRVQKKLKT